MIDPPADLGAVVAGPERRGQELQWRLRLPDGRAAVLAQLAPELAADEALRRRYVYEVERLRDLGAPALAPILAVGPEPDPRDPAAAPPYRLRLDPPGQPLEDVLARAPLPLDEALELGAQLADAVHGVHAAGAVLRDLEPQRVVRGADRVWIADAGQTRLAILSSRTASSMLLESSPYAAPEHLRATVVDARADVYSLGVILWRALTGELPHGDAHQILLGGTPRAELSALRPDAPDALGAILAAALAESPEERPESARVFAELLRGERALGGARLERVACQACGAELRAGLRLCLRCGKESVQLRHLGGGERGFRVILRAAREDEAFHAALRDTLAEVAEDRPARFEFLIGDARMYSKAEREGRVRLPAVLFADLPEDTAAALAERLRARKLQVKVARTPAAWVTRRRGRALILAGAAAMVGAPVAVVAGAAAAGVAGLFGGAALLIGGISVRSAARRRNASGLARLRAAPAALPASDPLVARLAAALGQATAEDLRERVADLALSAQHLVDQRARRIGNAAEHELVTEPVAELVEVAAREAERIAELDRELAALDEGALVRAIGASEARGEPEAKRQELLAGLDQLRALEDRRAAGMRRLLDAGALLRRAVELGAAVADPEAESQRLARLALAELE